MSGMYKTLLIFISVQINLPSSHMPTDSQHLVITQGYSIAKEQNDKFLSVSNWKVLVRYFITLIFSQPSIPSRRVDWSNSINSSFVLILSLFSYSVPKVMKKVDSMINNKE